VSFLPNVTAWNLGEAIAVQKDRIMSFFRGLRATLFHEVPFYIAGVCLYGEAKMVS
jgi:phosphatidylinositol phospholipase C delta